MELDTMLNDYLACAPSEMPDIESKILQAVGPIKTVKDFDAALAGVNGKSLEERTNTVLNIVERMAGDVTLTGKGDRFNINPRFLEVLMASCKAAGLMVQQRTIGSMGNIASNRRSADSMFGAGFNAGNAGGSVFNSNSGNSPFGGTGLGGGVNLNFGIN